MPQIRIATFNIENLLSRFDFFRYGKLTKEPVLEILSVEPDEEGTILRKALHVSLTDDSRQMTAQAVRETKADVVCLQEVDDKDVLDAFHKYYLEKAPEGHYGWRRLIEGNDRRGIDVAVISRHRIQVTSHSDITFADFGLFNDKLLEYGLSEGDSIFRRDCLEVEVKWDNSKLFIFVCHLKSMCNGRDETKCVREAESAALKRIIHDKYQGNEANEDWVIVGDLNDYKYRNGQQFNDTGLETLFQNNFSFNIIENLNPNERWTQYYPGENALQQLDYILLSPKLKQKNANANPDIIRKGQPYRVPGLENAPRYPRVGFDRPKASDHCPVAVTLSV